MGIRNHGLLLGSRISCRRDGHPSPSSTLPCDVPSSLLDTKRDRVQILALSKCLQSCACAIALPDRFLVIDRVPSSPVDCLNPHFRQRHLRANCHYS